jgi:signal transduction histidine kinase
MLDYLNFIARDLAPHGYCLLWQPELVWTHVIADALIAAAYFSIPIAIVRFVMGRKDIEFSWIFWLFALFIVACGTTHLMGIWVLWNADYGWQALIKVITAIASVGTAIVLWPLIPKALAIPSPLQLKQANADLAERVRERDEALDRLQREVSERERAEAALIQAQKMEAVGQLTGGIAHDFNNLLQAVSGTLDLIARSPGDPGKVRQWAERGRSAAERGARLTAQLLAFSRTQKLDLKPVEAAPLILGVLDLLNRTIGSSVTIVTAVEDHGATVIADRTQVELALLNLAINARDAMPEGGTLTISTAEVTGLDDEGQPADFLAISVADTGTGMSEEVQARAFEPFFTTKEVGKGTGLGLAMVYGVAKQSGGDVAIDSAPGRGTTITIRLRRTNPVRPAAKRDAGASGNVDVPHGRGETILLVDDDEDVRTALRNTLDQIGYVVEAAAGGEQALALLRERHFDLLLADYAMPGMTGAELAREAALIHPGMPVLFASGYSDTEAVEAAVGPDAILLRKPFQLCDLAPMLRLLLSNNG